MRARLSLLAAVASLGLLAALAGVHVGGLEVQAQQIEYQGPGDLTAIECGQAVTKAPVFACVSSLHVGIQAGAPSDFAIVSSAALLASPPQDRDDSPPLWQGCREQFEYYVMRTGDDPETDPPIASSSEPGWPSSGSVLCADVGNVVVDLWVINGLGGDPYGGDFCTTTVTVTDFFSLCP